MDAALRDDDTAKRLAAALADGCPTVIDAGALDLLGRAAGPVVITPHFGELARMIGATTEQIAANPAAWTVRAAEELGVTVLLKGHETHIAAPDGTRIVAASAPAWLATAGAGDALGGILGALVATHSDEIVADAGALARLAATASVIHGLAAQRASGGGPLVVMDVAVGVSRVIAELLSR
jgi:NAD(P)H-hydrate repair Nnr-like enzyme with NAD(P)H-hydrate dehydratase domain